MERIEYFLRLKANVEDGSEEIPVDQMPKKVKKEEEEGKAESKVGNGV